MECGDPVSGFEEERATFKTLDPRQLIGQFRNLGDAGPAYEILDTDAAGDVVVEIIYSEERLTYSLSEVLADPMATTIP
jgi:hypothetical protein